MATSKKSIATKASAIALAAALFIGLGSYSYLSGTTSTVENEFDKNENSVEIEETDNDYEIVPGTSQDKDPTLTVTYSLDSYVFVEVTDDTDGLVTWYIDNGWIYLSEETDNTTGATTYIYYQLLDYDEDNDTGTLTKEISILKGDKVYYSSSITNDEMKAAGDDISLTFQAYIIQAQLSGTTGDSLDDPLTAYNVVTTGASVYVENATYVALTSNNVASELVSAIKTANSETGTTVIVLPEADDNTADIELTSLLSISDDTVIDLNGNTLTGGSSYRVVQVSNGAEATLVDGEIKTTLSYGVMAFNDSIINIDNVDVSSEKYGVFADSSTLDISNSTISVASGNSSSVTAAILTQSGNNSVTIANSVLTTGDYGVGIFDQGANNEVTIDDCTITSDYFGVYHNGSTSPVTIKITDSTITDTRSGGIYISNASTAGREKQTLTVDNCTVTGPTAIEIKHTNATITNTTMIATVATPETHEYGNGMTAKGFSFVVSTNNSSDYVTGTVVVKNCKMYNSSAANYVAGGTENGEYFVYTLGEGASVTIDGKAATITNSYGE